MGQGQWTVPVTALPGACAGSIAWRRHGRLHVTVVVKASFAFAPGGFMTWAEPQPIVRPSNDEPDDMAPFNKRIDVWLTGHARVNPAHTSFPVRFVLYREGDMLIDKSMDLAGQVQTHAGYLPLGGFGPIDRPRVVDLSAPIVELSAELDLDALQWAPCNQRIKNLVGDEWVALAGTHPELGDFATQLPSPKAAARMHTSLAPGHHREIPLFVSSLVVDLDKQLCSLTWRGQTALANPAAMATTHLVAGVELPGHPLRWRDPFGAAQPSSRRGMPTAQSAAHVHQLRSHPAVQVQLAAMPAKQDLLTTAAVDHPQDRTREPAMPFGGNRAAPAPVAKQIATGIPSGTMFAIEQVDAEAVLSQARGAEWWKTGSRPVGSSSHPPPESTSSTDTADAGWGNEIAVSPPAPSTISAETPMSSVQGGARVFSPAAQLLGTVAEATVREIQRMGRMAMPFSGKKAAPASPEAATAKMPSGTMALQNLDVEALLAAQKPMPFAESERSSPPPPPSAPPPPQPVSSWPSGSSAPPGVSSAPPAAASLPPDFSGTMDFTPSAVSAATPFNAQAAAPPPSDMSVELPKPLSRYTGTTDLTDMGAEQLAASLPFQGDAVAPQSAVAPVKDPFSGTTDLTHANWAALAQSPTTPFSDGSPKRVDEVPVRMIADMSLGQHFLAAMAALGQSGG